MKNLLLPIALMFLLLLPLLGRAQEIWISGRVVDGDTQAPIPFPTISLRETKATVLGDEYGFFQLAGPQSRKQDSIIVTTLGYMRSAIVVKQKKAQKLLVKLCKWEYQLLEPPIGAMKLDGEIHISDKPLPKPENIRGIPGTQYAFLICNENKGDFSELKSVSFYIDELAFPSEGFRIRIYKVDDINHHPGADVLTESIIVQPVQPIRLGEWYTIDFKSYDIPAPQEDFFVAFEYGLFNRNSTELIADYTSNGQVLRPKPGFREQNIWAYSIEKGWELLPQNTLRRYNAMIKAETVKTKAVRIH